MSNMIKLVHAQKINLRMFGNYSAPGIYSEEPTLPLTQIIAASTSIMAMLGGCQKGPPNTPFKCGTYAEFNNVFGTYYNGFWMPQAARQFFENGGVALWVSRVVGSNGAAGTAASVQVTNGTSNNFLMSAYSVGAHGNALSYLTTRISTVITTLAVNLGAGATTVATITDYRRVYVGAQLNIAQGGNNLRVVVTAIQPTGTGVQAVITFVSSTPTGAITASGSTITLEEWSMQTFRNGIFAKQYGISPGNYLAMNSTAGQNYFVTYINNNDPTNEIVITTDNALGVGNAVDPRPATITVPVFLTGGADGTAIADADVVGVQSTGSAAGTGMYAFDQNREASVICAPGYETAAVQQGLVTYCETRLIKGLMFICAVPQNTTPTGALTWTGTTAQLYSTFGAIYYPWIQQVDPNTGIIATMPPTGVVLGIYSRVAQARGPQKAPAGVVDGRMTNVISLERTLMPTDVASLNPAGINCLLTMPNRGIVVYGARTLGGGQFVYVNIRRVFNFFEASIQQSLDAVVFENNDAITQGRVSRALDAFCLTNWQNNVLVGASAQQAYLVECDSGDNPPAVQNAGQLVADVSLAIANPAEFVVIRYRRDLRQQQAALAAAALGG